MDIVPKETQEPLDDVYERYPLVLSDRAEWGKRHNKLGTKASRRTRLREAFEDAFELVGGVPRLATEMDEDYLEFMKMAVKLAPSESEVKHSGSVTIVSAIERSPLDGEYEDVTDVSSRNSNSVRDAAALQALPHADDAIRGDGGASPSGEDSCVRQRTDS